MNKPIGTWKKQLQNGDSSEILTVVGFDDKKKVCHTNTGRSIPLSSLELEYKYYEIEELAPNPFKNINLGMLSPEIKASEENTPSKESILEASDKVVFVGNDNSHRHSMLGAVANPLSISVPVSPEAQLIENAIKLSKNKVERSYDIRVNIRVPFEVEKVCDTARMFNVDENVLSEQLLKHITLDQTAILKALIENILNTPRNIQ